MKNSISKRISAMILLLLCSAVFFSFKRTNNTFKLPKSLKKQFSFIPGGNVILENDTLSVNGFYISNFEISNIQYGEFLAALKEEGKSRAYNIAQIDSSNWLTEHPRSSLDPFTEFYHSHEAYNNYPVVNVSIEGAKLYCKWLTEKINSEIPGGNYKVLVRLPYRAEWLRAANGNNSYSPYSWKGPYLRDEKGMLLCNFKHIGAESITYDEKAETFSVKDISSEQPSYMNDAADITAQVNSYFPNDFGLYNMNGNVAELVEDNFACGGSWSSTGYDVRNQSKMAYERPSSKIGFRPVITIVGS